MKVQIKDQARKAKGRVSIRLEDRDGSVVERAFENTVVEGFYVWALRQLAVPLVGDEYREPAVKIVLGTNPEPTSWDMTFESVAPRSEIPLSANVPAPTGLSVTMSAMADFDDCNGDDGTPRTYYELAMVTDADRLLARVVGRNSDGSIAGLTKSNRQRLYIDWTIYWLTE